MTPVDQLRQFVEDSPARAEGELPSVASSIAQGAARTLLNNWEAQRAAGEAPDLVTDIDDVVRELNQFRALAARTVPRPVPVVRLK